MRFLNKMERKFGRFAIQGLMKYLVVCYIVGYCIEYLAPNLYGYLTLEPYMIFHYGQVWRLVSWILIPPPTGNIIFAVIMIVLYYQLGNALENTWGSFRFNLYIFGGVIFSIIGALILYAVYGGNAIGFGDSFSTYYINMGIFLAFALCFPDMRIMLYFIIPVKMKWMAIVYAALMAYSAVRSSWAGRVAIIASILNFLIFFFATRNYQRVSPKEIRRKRDFRRQTSTPRGANITKHKCAICGRTELDDPTLQFRFCSKCNGNYEYCQDHLFTHKHIV